MSDEFDRPNNYTFSWKKLGTDDYEVFLRWLFVHLLVDDARDSTTQSKFIERLGELTDRFDKVTLTVQVNGVQIDPEHLIRGIHDRTARFARSYAIEQLRASSQLVDLRSTLNVIETAARSRIEHVAADLGLELPTEEAEL